MDVVKAVVGVFEHFQFCVECLLGLLEWGVVPRLVELLSLDASAHMDLLHTIVFLLHDIFHNTNLDKTAVQVSLAQAGYYDTFARVAGKFHQDRT